MEKKKKKFSAKGGSAFGGKTKKNKRAIKHKKRTAKKIGERWITKEKEKVKLTKKEQIFEDRVKAVISRGRERGFVMETEIIKFFPMLKKTFLNLNGFMTDWKKSISRLKKARNL